MDTHHDTSLEVKNHPFGPVIFKDTSKLIVGTMPPESADFYYSNSSNTRMWDLLKTIEVNEKQLCKGSYLLQTEEKKRILESMGLGMCDIIKRYIRIKEDTVDDKFLIPVEYFNLPEIIKDTRITTLLFVYQSAAQMFLHSLEGSEPKPFNQLQYYQPAYGEFHTFTIKGRTIKCILLPNPLNRGRKGESIDSKLNQYYKAIK